MQDFQNEFNWSVLPVEAAGSRGKSIQWKAARREEKHNDKSEQFLGKQEGDFNSCKLSTTYTLSDIQSKQIPLSW